MLHPPYKPFFNFFKTVATIFNNVSTNLLGVFEPTGEKNPLGIYYGITVTLEKGEIQCERIY